MPARRRWPRTLLVLLLALSPTLSCVDGPYPIANPNDPLMTIEMHLVGGADTIRVAGQQVIFQLVTDPVVSGYEPEWTSSDPAWFFTRGAGRFANRILPPTNRTVLVSGGFGDRTASQAVVIMAAAP